jgi:hypothetical protein
MSKAKSQALKKAKAEKIELKRAAGHSPEVAKWLAGGRYKSV